MSPHTHSSVMSPWWCIQGWRMGTWEAPEPTQSSHTEGRCPGDVRAPGEPLFTFHLGNRSAEEGAAPSAAGTGWLCLHPSQDSQASLLLSLWLEQGVKAGALCRSTGSSRAQWSDGAGSYPGWWRAAGN